MKNILQKFMSDTPYFFKKLRNWGIAVGAIGGAILAIPASVVVLPSALLVLATHAVTVGVVTAAVSQAVTHDDNGK